MYMVKIPLQDLKNNSALCLAEGLSEGKNWDFP